MNNGLIDLGKTLKMVDDMEVIEKFVGKNGKFIGDTVQIKISDLARRIKRAEAGQKGETK